MTANHARPKATQRAVDGCDLIVDCIGLPMKQIAHHVSTARNVRGAYSVVVLGASVVESLGLPADPENPRCPKPTTGGRAAPVRFRRDPEDILLDAGAAIINLTQFYGPEVHVSTLQQAVVETVAGKLEKFSGTIADVGNSDGTALLTGTICRD